IMMNAGIFLVPTVHEIAIAAELAIAARTAEKSDAHALPNRPALDTGTKRIDPPNELVARDARPINGELALHRAGIRAADPTRLDTNSDLTRRGRRQFPLHHFEAARLGHLNGAISLHHVWLLNGHRRPSRYATSWASCSSFRLKFGIWQPGLICRGFLSQRARFCGVLSIIPAASCLRSARCVRSGPAVRVAV